MDRENVRCREIARDVELSCAYEGQVVETAKSGGGRRDPEREVPDPLEEEVGAGGEIDAEAFADNDVHAEIGPPDRHRRPRDSPQVASLTEGAEPEHEVGRRATDLRVPAVGQPACQAPHDPLGRVWMGCGERGKSKPDRSTGRERHACEQQGACLADHQGAEEDPDREYYSVEQALREESAGRHECGDAVLPARRGNAQKVATAGWDHIVCGGADTEDGEQSPGGCAVASRRKKVAPPERNERRVGENETKCGGDRPARKGAHLAPRVS